MFWSLSIGIALIFVFGTFLFQKLDFRKKFTMIRAETIKDKEKVSVWPPPIIPFPDLTPENLPEHCSTPWRPYKPMEYRLTMGLSALEPSQWIQIDSGYPERISKRKELIERYPEIVYGFKPEMVPAIEELYEYLLGHYLPLRYPGLFRVFTGKDGGPGSGGVWFENLVTRDCHPVTPPSRKVRSTGSDRTEAVNYMLRVIGTTIEEDFLMLIPDSLLLNGGEGSEYIMRAFCTCFPSGFNAPGFLGKPLAGIHALVPGYKETLQMSMDRFFTRIMVGKPWRRWNWTVTAHNELCVPHGNETYENEMPKPVENNDPSKAQLRVEYQTLTRLHNTKAIIFTVRTYLTPLSHIRNELPPVHIGTEGKPEPGYGTPSGGGGPRDLADAIEGIKGPMMEYKNFHKFNERVIRYLRTGEKW